MATKSIYERANAHAVNVCGCKFCTDHGTYCLCRDYNREYAEYVKIATDQDRIARDEERERCIRLATKVYADLLSASGYDIGSINSELQRLRKAIEEGGNND